MPQQDTLQALSEASSRRTQRHAKTLKAERPLLSLKRSLTSGHNSSLGDLFAHLVPHVHLMPPKTLKREFLIITLNMLRDAEQNFDVSPHLKYHITDRAHSVVTAPLSRLAEEIVGFVLWLDGFRERTPTEDELKGTSRHRKRKFRADCLDTYNKTYTDKGKDIILLLDALFFCYDVKRFGIEAVDGPSFFAFPHPNLRIIIGDAEPYQQASYGTTKRILRECYNVNKDGLLNNFRAEILLHTKISTFTGDLSFARFKIKELTPVRNEICICMQHGDLIITQIEDRLIYTIKNLFMEIPMFRRLRETSTRYE